ncbi:hypothetical protein [Tritonibacter mobilis]|uniref:hypothetical protein n=1 Tax=Tritonibacter mobilis TaxID=379347 RepID=UPI001C093993|nr:hypothetical protein [Tritonibacter mobilis]MBU3033636.1 hypothetical protein [Tritonibacter mobilis]WHQ84387.1 hypothetical protein OMR53_19745 [Tritonibacter mobilis]
MRIKDYPLPTVEIACKHCKRRGRYSLDRFVEIVGGETLLPWALHIISQDCPEDRPGPRNLDGKCNPYYAQDWARAVKRG